MINEKRVRLMTRMAIYEGKNELELEQVQTYFRSDYIGVHLLKNSFRVTLAFLIGLLGWGSYNMEELIVDITNIDVVALAFKIIFVYVFVLCVFLAITYIIYAVKYAHAKQELTYYHTLMQMLVKEYESEDRGAGRRSTIGGHEYGKST